MEVLLFLAPQRGQFGILLLACWSFDHSI